MTQAEIVANALHDGLEVPDGMSLAAPVEWNRGSISFYCMRILVWDNDVGIISVSTEGVTVSLAEAFCDDGRDTVVALDDPEMIPAIERVLVRIRYAVFKRDSESKRAIRCGSWHGCET